MHPNNAGRSRSDEEVTVFLESEDELLLGFSQLRAGSQVPNHWEKALQLHDVL